MKRCFLHLSDIHYLIDYTKCNSFYAEIFKELTPPVEQIRSLVKEVNVTDIDFVLISGDLTENGNDEDYKHLKMHLREIFGNIPIIVTLGNHDNIKEFNKGWLGSVGINESSYHVLVNEAGINIISLDSSSEKHPDGMITEADCDWLEEAIQDSKNEPTILLTHHHLLDSQFSMPKAQYPEKFIQLVRDSNIIAVFNGHTHHFYSGEFAGKPYFTADSVSFSAEYVSDNHVYFVQRPGLTFFCLENGKIIPNRIGGIKISKYFGIFKPKEEI
ncbi:MAG: metallophosphoesterase [Tepidanaerobacteraceae bacterium]